jgi:mannosyltransferase
VILANFLGRGRGYDPRLVQVAKEAPSPAATARVGSAALAHPHILVAVLTLITGGLGFLRLEYRAVHFDESISIDRTDESWASLWHIVTREDPNMSLYYAVLKLWTGLFGDSLLAVRSLSVVAAALCVPVVYAIGVRLFGVSAGLVAGLLISTNVFLLRYAQEARAYALVALLAALSTYFFLAEVERPRRGSRAGYVASSALAFYLHFFALWVILVHVLTLAAVKGREAISRSWLACYAAIGLLAAPMAYWALILDEDPIGWLAEPGWDAIPATLAQLAGDSFLHLGAVLAVCLLALPRAARSKRLAFGLAFTAAWAVLPLVAAFALSQVKPVLLAKYLIVSLPAMALLAAGALTSLRPVGLALAAACTLVALSGPELRSWYGFPGNEDWRSLTAFVLQRTRPADGIVYNAGYARDTVVDYSRSSESTVPASLPADASLASAPTRPRVWLVLAHSQPVTPVLRSALVPRYRLESRQVFDGDVAVELYVLREG